MVQPSQCRPVGIHQTTDFVMQKLKHLVWIRYLCSCLAAFLLVASVSSNGQNHFSSEDFAKAILAKVDLEKGFQYDVAKIVPITDGKTRETKFLCYLFGGPPTSTTGAVGVFDSTGFLLDAQVVKGLYEYETNASVLVDNDSVILRTLNASGTGLHEESLVVLTLVNGKLIETFRCSGLRYSLHGEFYDQTVQLVFCDLYGDGTREIVRLVKTNQYASGSDQENCKPSVIRSFAEVFQFDVKIGRFVRAFE